MNNFFKSLTPICFLYPKNKPSDIYRMQKSQNIKNWLSKKENAKAFIYTIVEDVNIKLLGKTVEQQKFKEDVLKFILQDYLQGYLLEEDILILQSEIIIEWQTKITIYYVLSR